MNYLIIEENIFDIAIRARTNLEENGLTTTACFRGGLVTFFRRIGFEVLNKFVLFLVKRLILDDVEGAANTDLLFITLLDFK